MTRQRLYQLPVRVRNPLINKGYDTDEAIAAATDDELLVLRNMGKAGLREIRSLIPYQEQQGPDATFDATWIACPPIVPNRF